MCLFYQYYSHYYYIQIEKSITVIIITITGYTIREDNTEVRLNKGAKGPAVTLTIEGKGSPTISVDLTPKIALSPSVHSLENFDWPRKETKSWLDKNAIKNILNKQLYLVPKGDKYWRISFANWENALFPKMDSNGTWRKGCLRLMKKKLSLWRSQSRTGLKGISSYQLKVIFCFQYLSRVI